MRAIRKADDHDLVGKEDVELVPGMANPSAAAEELEQKKLLKASFIAKSMTVVLTLALLILWPMPMYGSGYIFSQKFFTGWVVVGMY
jgi:urea-proton symporter